MQVELTDDGYWVDGDGKRWRLVPVKTTGAQMDAALAKAQKWGLKGKQAKAAAWDYMMGYYELVEHAPAPIPMTPNASLTGVEPVGGASELKR